MYDFTGFSWPTKPLVPKDSKLFGLRSKTPETARSSNAQSPNYVSQEVCAATESTIAVQSKAVWITLMKSTV